MFFPSDTEIDDTNECPNIIIVPIILDAETSGHRPARAFSDRYRSRRDYASLLHD